MADKVDKTPAGALPLSMPEKKKMKKQAARAAHALPAVRDVILWTIFHAGNVTFSVAFGTAYYMLIITIFSQPPSWLLPRPEEMTDAAAADVTVAAGALMAGMLWCATPQAAAGVLALMLPRNRRRLRLFLAYAALVATVASHCMYAASVRMFVAADPEDLYLRTVCTAGIFVSGVGDLICFLGLVLRGGEE